ncbi:ABC transporter permease [Micromonospora sp. WMMD714]|uniref:ABC transporter permease n=1 Tax=Micromonospora sp. WMMD714 TaxID=3016097 RepID=UPI00249B9A3E|nr:ABC transporter permease [Micromonospora sp. WMMD714]WFE66398.1 ABC transporter permease [Micromonospora sp. WMMD714]
MRRFLIRVVSYTWLVLALVLVAEVLLRWRNSSFTPPPSRVAGAFVDLWWSGPAYRLFASDAFVADVGASMFRLGIGYALAVAVGTLVGVALGRSRRLEWLCAPVVRLGVATPAVVLIPIAIVLLGINDRMPIFVIAFGSVWPVVFNAMDGVANVDRLALNSARAIGLRRVDRFRFVVLPAALPRILAGARVSLGIAVVLMVSSELYASTSGVGYQILLQQQKFDTPRMFAGVVMACAIGILFNALFGLYERWALRGRPTVGRSA